MEKEIIPLKNIFKKPIIQPKRPYLYFFYTFIISLICLIWRVGAKFIVENDVNFDYSTIINKKKLKTKRIKMKK